MSRLRQREVVLESVGMKMLEEGKILGKRQYDRCDKVPVRSVEVLRHFSSWSRMLSLLKTAQPKIWSELESMQEKKDDPLAELAAGNSSEAALSSKETI